MSLRQVRGVKGKNFLPQFSKSSGLGTDAVLPGVHPTQGTYLFCELSTLLRGLREVTDAKVMAQVQAPGEHSTRSALFVCGQKASPKLQSSEQKGKGACTGA